MSGGKVSKPVVAAKDQDAVYKAMVHRQSKKAAEKKKKDK